MESTTSNGAQGIPPPLLQLPHEILDDILSSLDQHSDLLSLALTCHHLASSIIPYHTDYRVLRIRTLHPTLFAHLARRRDLTRNVREVHICERHNYTSADRAPRLLVDKELDMDPATNGTNDERVRVWNVVRSLRYMWDLRAFTWSWNFPAGTTSQNQAQGTNGSLLGGMGSGVGRVGGPVRPTSDHRYEEAILAEVVRKPSLRHFGLSGGFGLHVTGLPLDKGYSYPVWHLSNLTSICLLGDAWLKSCNALPLCFMFAKSPNLEYLEIPLEFKHLHTLRFPCLKKVKLHLQSGATTSVDSSSARFLENNPTIEDLSWYPIGVPIFQPHAPFRPFGSGNERGKGAEGQGIQLVLPNLKCLKTNLQGLEAFENEWELKRQLVETEEEDDDDNDDDHGDGLCPHSPKLPKIQEEEEAGGGLTRFNEEEERGGGYATYPPPRLSENPNRNSTGTMNWASYLSTPSTPMSQNPNRNSTGSINWASYLSTPSTPMSPSWPWTGGPSTPATSFGSTFGQMQQELDYGQSYYSNRASPPASPFVSTFGPPPTPISNWTNSSFSTFSPGGYPSASPSVPSPIVSTSTTARVPLSRLRKRRLTSLDVSGLNPSHLLSLPFVVPSSLKKVTIHRFSTHADVERLVDVAQKFEALEWVALPSSVRHAGGGSVSPRGRFREGEGSNGDVEPEDSRKAREREEGEWWSSGSYAAPLQTRSSISLDTLLRILPLFSNLRILRGRVLWSAVMNEGDDPDAMDSECHRRVRDHDTGGSGSEQHQQHRRDHPTEYHKMKMHKVLGKLIRLCPKLAEVDHCDWYEKRWAWKRVVVLRRREIVPRCGGQIQPDCEDALQDKGKQKAQAYEEVEVVGYEVRKPYMRDCFDVLDGAFN